MVVGKTVKTKLNMKNKKPAIRFKGFSEEWEEHKLGSLAKLGSSKRVHREDYAETGIPFFRGSEISKLGNSSKLEDVLYISNEYYIELKEKYGVPQIGDILLTAVGTLGNSFLVHDGTPFYFKDGNLIWINDIQINSDYLNIYIGDGIGKKRVLDSAAGSNQKALTMVNLQNVAISVPKPEEQTQIGNFFKNLDNLILLHQRKYEKLGILKKAMLEKMFPKNGADVPEIRFKGFEGAWEERKLGEIVQIKDSARVPKELWVESGIRYLRSSDLENNGQGGELFISIEAYENYKSKTGVPERGDVLFNSGGDIGFSILKTDDSPVYVQGGAILYARTSQSKDIDGGYLNVYFSTPQMKKYIDIASAGGTIKHFTLKPANAAPIIFPNKEEQAKIGNYFKNLDNLLKLHEGEIEKLKNLKKAMLEKMFV